MRPRLSTLIFHGAPPPPTPSPLAEACATASPAPRPYESFNDFESAELLTEDDDREDESERPTPYLPGLPELPGQPGQLGFAASERPPPRPSPSPRWRTILVSGVALVAAVVITVSVRARERSVLALPPAVAAVPPAAVAPPAPAAARLLGTCAAGSKPKVLARRAMVRGGIEAAATEDRVAFAALTASNSGAAFELDATTLALEGSVRLASAAPLHRIVPAIDAEAPLDVLADTNALRTVLDPEGPASIGTRDGAVVFGPHDGGGMVRLWKLDWPSTIEAPRGARLGVAGEHAVVFRRNGAIWIGSFRGGEVTSDLTRLSLPGNVGNPSLDARGDEALAAWAQRASASAPWGVRWTRWTASRGPGPVHELELPPGGPGERSMAPSLVALKERRFLLAWTETGHGRNQVRAQVIDASDHGLGAPFDVSPPDAIAGQEQIALSEGGKGAIAYLVARRGAFELSATSIDCSP